MFIIWFGVLSANPSSVHTSIIDLVFMELLGWKPEELQITEPINNPALLILISQLTIQKLFQYVQWLLVFEQTNTFSTVCHGSLSVNAIYWNSAAMSTFCSEIVTIPSGFGCIICLARVHTRKLPNFDRGKSKHLNGFLCIHFHLGYNCCHIINYY